MNYDEAIALLKQARTVLERHMFEGNENGWDDIAELCMKIDDQLPPAAVQAVPATASAGNLAA